MKETIGDVKIRYMELYDKHRELEQQLKEANKVVDLFKNHLEICLIFVYDENGCTCGFEKRNEYLEKYKVVSDDK
jgi:hypothetical protein